MRSIGTVLDDNRGLGGGFDFLRIALAFAVLTWHVPAISGLKWQYTAPFVWLIDYAVLIQFFALSGFLISGSAIRLSLKNFLINRGLRIFPALAVEVVLSAIILGPIFTTLPLGDYFANPLTWKYFTNIVALINYRLPGVFTSNLAPQVNGPLWTVPYEMMCYAIMSLLVLATFAKRSWLPVAGAMAILAIGLTMTVLIDRGMLGRHDYPILSSLFYERGSRLFVSFLLGIAAYQFRFRLPYSWGLFGVACAYILVVAGLGHGNYPYPVVDAITVVPLVYITAFIGVTRMPPIPFFHRGDYSYGIYLYGWPATQVWLAAVPSLTGNRILLWLASCALATLFAVLSWHLIEKPILRVRKRFSFVARQRLADDPGGAPAGPAAAASDAVPQRG